MKIKSATSTVLLAGLLLLLMVNCKKEAIKTPPLLTISAISNITATTAICGGEITNGGGATVTERGVCWSVNPNPTIEDNKTTNGTGLGSFVSTVTGLAPGTTYNIKAYAINSAGTGYSNQSSFKTVTLAPVLTTTELSGVTSTTAIGGGNITNDGGSPVIARGICWSLNQKPTIADNKTSSDTGSGSFTGSITGLLPGATYYFRAFATNIVGTAYGNQVNTTTKAILPTITTSTSSSITSTTAISGGTITSDGGAAVTARGVCWSTNQSPTIANNKSKDGTSTGSFISSIMGLNPTTTYYIRAYATNSIGTAYGNQVTTTTIAGLPAIITTTITTITATTAISGGNITSDSGSAVTARGVCWNTTQNPTTVNYKTTDGNGIGSFTSSITGLTANTTYYLRAYATNNSGTVYGTQIEFGTLPSESLSVSDIDGNIYHTVTIGTQVWMVENLKTTKYLNGDLIGTTSSATLDISNQSTPKYQWPYAGNEINVATYGRLYTWYAVTDSRGVCPAGWHIPTDNEFTTLTNYLINNGYGYMGSGDKIAKSMAATSGWITYSVSGNAVGYDQAKNNSSGFTALPGGRRHLDGTFLYIGTYGYWWSSTEGSTIYSMYRFIYYSGGNVGSSYDFKQFGFSVRCVRN